MTAWIHFKRRLLERHNIKITQSEYKKICKDIREQKMERYLIQTKEDGNKVYKIPIHGALVEVVFKVKEGLLSTALPKWKVRLTVK